MISSVILCDRREHVNLAHAMSPASAVVALTPECGWLCQCQGIPYLRLDDFCVDAAINDLAKITLHREYAWAKWVDDALWQAVPDFASAGFTPARGHLYFLKRTLDGIILPARVLQDFVASARPERMIVFARSPFCPDLNHSLAERPLHAWLAPDIAGGITKVEVWPDLTASRLLNRFKGKSRYVAQRLRRASMRRVIGRIVRSLAFVYKNPSVSRARVAWIGHEYDMVFAIPLLQRQSIAVVRPPSWIGGRWAHRTETERVSAILQKEMERLVAAPAFWQVLDPVSSSLRRFAEPFLRQWILREVPRAWACLLAAQKWYRQEKIQAVFGTEVQSVLTSSMFMAARALGIPRIAAIHNPPGGAAELPVQDSLGPIQSDVYLVNGEGDSEYFEILGKRLAVFPRAQLVPVGSARLEALRAVRNSHTVAKLRTQFKGIRARPLLLYIPTAFMGCHRYFNEGHISDVAYFELQKRILGSCAEFPNVQILYKPTPSDYAANPILEFLAQAVPNALVTWKRIDDLIWAVDAIIVDFAGSTTLAEAAITNKPMLVYAGKDWSRLLPQAKAALQKRAWVSETPDEFEAQLRRFLSAGDFVPLANPDDEFLRLYVTHLNDGHAAKRAADAITQVALAHPALRRPAKQPAHLG